MFQRDFDDSYNPSLYFTVEQSQMIYEQKMARRAAMDQQALMHGGQGSMICESPRHNISRSTVMNERGSLNRQRVVTYVFQNDN